jgi:hypothetical protein
MRGRERLIERLHGPALVARRPVASTSGGGSLLTGCPEFAFMGMETANMLLHD